MDLSAFSNVSFDVKDWVNSTYDQTPEAERDKEAFVSSLIVKLQLFIQEVNISLEDTAQQVIQYLPRVTREVEAMRQEAVMLHDQMKTIKQDIVKLERDSASSMQMLLQIDSIKNKMQDATKALKEADNWSTLSADVDEVFQRGDISEISSKLIGMQTSLENLVDVPDFKERCQRLENLKNQLEAILSPHLIATFNAKSFDATQIYARIFRDIKRLPQMIKYYQKWQKSQLSQSWRAIVEADPEENLLDWLNTFYDQLLSTWHQQVTWCGQILPETPVVPLLSDVFMEVLSSLEPSLGFCLEAALKMHPDDPLPFIISVKQMTDGFSRSLDLAIQTQSPASNQRLFSPHLINLAQALYSPLRSYMHKYAMWLERQLEMQAPAMHKKSDEWQDSVTAMGDSVGKVFTLLCQAESQCQQLSNRCAYPALIKAIKSFYVWYLANFVQCCVSLRDSQKKSAHDPLEDEAWNTFQQVLHMLHILGEVLLRLDNLEQIFQSNLGEAIKFLGYPLALTSNNNTSTILMTYEERSEVNPFYAYDNLLLTSNAGKEFRELILRYQQDEKTLLLNGCREEAHKVCAQVAQIAFDLIFDSIRSRLQLLPSLKVWEEEQSEGALISDLPTFSLSPQGYITEIGQFLMTLPQHMEPFALQENVPLLRAMALAQFPYASLTDEAENVAEFLLSYLARATLEMFVEQALKIPNLTPHSTRQLLKDLGYLSDVLEDLGLSSCQSLNDLCDLLKASPAEFMTVARGKPYAMSNVIINMRKLKIGSAGKLSSKS